MIVEVAYTAMLCFVVTNVACTESNNSKEDPNCFFGLAIGFVIIAGAYGAGGVSGGAFNPAVTLGMDIPFDPNLFSIWYCIFQFAGAIIAALLWKLCRVQEDGKRWPEEPALWAKAVAEFLGTFMLVFTVGLNITVKSPATAWSAAAALLCMIYALGDVSGGHFNPAVTLALQLTGKDKERFNGVLYVIVQLIAGITGGCLSEWIHCSGRGSYKNHAFKVSGTAPNPGFNWGQVGVAEVFFTFLLTFVVLSVACYPKQNGSITRHTNQFAFAIGACVMVGGTAIGAVSGGHMNPAVSMGISSGASWVCSDHGAAPLWTNCLLYGLLQLGGGAAAALIYVLTHPDDYK